MTDAAAKPAPKPGDDPLKLSDCQGRLAAIWVIGTLLLCTIILVQIAGGKYGDDDDKAWGWLLPNLLPTLAMIGGAVVYQVKNQGPPLLVARFAYRATWGLSLVYLLLMLATVVLVPLAEQMRGLSPIDWLTRPHALLTGLSAIVSGALGAFFVSTKPETPGPS